MLKLDVLVLYRFRDCQQLSTAGSIVVCTWGPGLTPGSSRVKVGGNDDEIGRIEEGGVEADDVWRESTEEMLKVTLCTCLLHPI